ncbi:MAG: hypothetical protein PHS95_02160 [Candidatus Pacebacteria bacterium]|nr:hypothetical protein [Candidatus Paceibacterota bacterium]
MEPRKIIAWVFTSLGVGIVLVYSYFVLEGYIRGPQIVVETPQSGFSTTTPLIKIAGKAIRANVFTLNGAEVPLDLQGNFSESLLLAEGYNIMKLTASDHYGREAKKTIEINLATTDPNRIEMPITATTTATSTITN